MRTLLGIDKLVRESCEYAWDHLAGEPDDFSVDDLYEHVKEGFENWYASSTPEERTSTS